MNKDFELKNNKFYQIFMDLDKKCEDIFLEIEKISFLEQYIAYEEIRLKAIMLEEDIRKCKENREKQVDELNKKIPKIQEFQDGYIGDFIKIIENEFNKIGKKITKAKIDRLNNKLFKSFSKTQKVYQKTYADINDFLLMISFVNKMNLNYLCDLQIRFLESCAYDKKKYNPSLTNLDKRKFIVQSYDDFKKNSYKEEKITSNKNLSNIK